MKRQKKATSTEIAKEEDLKTRKTDIILMLKGTKKRKTIEIRSRNCQNLIG